MSIGPRSPLRSQCGSFSDSESTFSGSQPLNQISVAVSCSQNFGSFGGNFDLVEEEGRSGYSDRVQA